jgi:hypothetical protein
MPGLSLVAHPEILSNSAPPWKTIPATARLHRVELQHKQALSNWNLIWQFFACPRRIIIGLQFDCIENNIVVWYNWNVLLFISANNLKSLQSLVKFNISLLRSFSAFCGANSLQRFGCHAANFQRPSRVIFVEKIIMWNLSSSGAKYCVIIIGIELNNYPNSNTKSLLFW